MLYILTIKKHFNQKGIHPSLQMVRNYIDLFGQNDLLICWPGYLCTNVKTANTFYKRFPRILPKGITFHRNPCFFFKGMNGGRNISGLTPARKTADYINDLYNGYSSMYGVNDDHSKIIAFCDMNNTSQPPHGANIDNIINDITNGAIAIKAMLIGSSNQSHNTLTKISPDKKGECDVFLFDGDCCGDENGAIALYNRITEGNREVDNQNFSIALTKEVASTLSLNDIFRHLLER